MTLVALANVLLGDLMVERFHADPRDPGDRAPPAGAVPREAPVIEPRPRRGDARRAAGAARARRAASARRTRRTRGRRSCRTAPTSRSSRTRGGGASFCRGPRRDALARGPRRAIPGSQFVYLRDVHTRRGLVRGATSPSARSRTSYLVEFLAEKAIIRRRDHEIETRLEVAVSPEDDAEVRRVSLTNRERPAARDRAHELRRARARHARRGRRASRPSASSSSRPSGSPRRTALLARRRPRVAARAGARRLPRPLHRRADRRRRSSGRPTGCASSGRGRGPDDPQALDGRALSGTTGAVLDPILSLRTRLRLAPGGFARLSFTTGVAADEAARARLAQKYHDPGVAARDLRPRLHARAGLAPAPRRSPSRRRSSSSGSARASSSPTPRCAPTTEILAQEHARARRASGGTASRATCPIVLVRVVEPDDAAARAAGAHRAGALAPQGAEGRRRDPERAPGELPRRDARAARAARGRRPVGRAGRGSPAASSSCAATRCPRPSAILLATVARAVLVGRPRRRWRSSSTVAEPEPPLPLGGAAPRSTSRRASRRRSLEPPPLVLANGLGGFTARRPRVRRRPRRASARRRCPGATSSRTRASARIVTASGAAPHLVGEQPREPADAVRERPGDRPDRRGDLPPRRGERRALGRDAGAAPADGRARRAGSCATAPGVTRFARAARRHRAGARGLRRARRAGEALAPHADEPLGPAAPAHASSPTTTGRSARRGRASPRFVVTERDAASGAVLARDLYDAGARAASRSPPRASRVLSATGDRLEFLGRNGSLARAAALGRAAPLRPRSAPASIPAPRCRSRSTSRPARRAAIVFLLGQGTDAAEARALLATLRRRATAPTPPRPSSRAVEAFWDETLGAVHVTTPDDSFDLLVNRWLLYQDLACRLWARSGYYQSSGAYGFRDQLQDVLALLFTRPDLTREHLLRAAGAAVRRGRRPALVERLDRRGHPDALLGRSPLAPVRDRRVRRAPPATAPSSTSACRSSRRRPFRRARPRRTACRRSRRETGTLFEHGVRAIDRALTAGRARPAADRQLRLERRLQPRRARRAAARASSSAGSSAPSSAPSRRSARSAATARARRATAPSASASATMLEQSWDGDWYRRAYFDDGTPLGSSQNDEGRIDSVAQTWAVLSGAAPRDARRARDGRRARPPRPPRARGVILLLTPPFDRTALDPGYIKGYIPGVRENGGQYTHAAAWVVLALARLGQRRRGGGALPHAQPDQPLAHRAPTSSATRPSPTSLAGDVYDHPAHRGRGGWTWYTGSAGWMYRVAVEGILGLERRRRGPLDRPLHPVLVALVLPRVAVRAVALHDRRREPGARLPRRRERHARREARRPGRRPARRRRRPRTACS